MALAHTILATLGNDSFSGYDLWKKFSECSNHYWQASQQQIYRELTKLEAQGAIASELVPQENRPNKKLYRITKEGKEILTRWLGEPSEPMAVREEVLVKVLSAHLVPPGVIIQELKRRRAVHMKQLEDYKNAEQEKFSNISELPLAEKCKYLTLRRGIRYEAEWVAWCEEAISIFEKTN